MNPVQDYHRKWARRHAMKNLDLIVSTPMLSDASFYEQCVHDGVLSLYQARKAFVGDYPQTNTIACVCRKKKCKHICKLSVLVLIRPKPPKTRKKSQREISNDLKKKRRITNGRRN